MIKIKTTLVLGCLVTASFFMSCNQEAKEAESAIEQKQEQPVKKVWTPEELNTSELALLMRAMWDSSMVIKEQIIKGEEVNSYADVFKTIHTAKATDPSELTETFHAFADIFEKNMEAVDAAQGDAAKTEAFNNLVTTCVSCHQQYCQGPIPKIKKLYIKE